MNHTKLRRLQAAALVAAAGTALVGVSAPAASAHPLGNFTVNYATSLTLETERVQARVVVDRAEIAAAQERPNVDANSDGIISSVEALAYARSRCATLAAQLRVDVDGRPVVWKPTGAGLTYQRGEAGLKTSRLECGLTAPADLRAPSDIAVRTTYASGRIGWREIIARGQGIALTDSDVPKASSTGELRTYPQGPLATPVDVRTAALRTEPGQSTAVSSLPDLPGAGPVTAALTTVTGTFNDLVGSRELTLPVGLMALVLAIILGASHAAMPGHGKTIMAAYLAGRRGTPKDAVAVGATVTLTHTAGVLVLGLLLPVATTLAGETVLAWLGLTSGLLVTGIGLWLLCTALRKGTPHTHQHQHHHHGHGHGHHHHSHDHSHGDQHHHGERPGQDGSGRHLYGTLSRLLPGRRLPTAAQDARHAGTVVVLTKGQDDEPLPATSPAPAPAPSPERASRGGLIGMGIAGGLVPSPSALVVLLGAVALGRTAFGVLLVIGYGLGMAATLTLAGLILVRLRDRIEAGSRHATQSTRWVWVRRWTRFGPIATSSLVLLVGLGLTLRAAAGPW
ncbi:nickel transporter [Streptomyces sp. H27-C3]|uniref:nickel/cobalt transporter n=1 Tax=Streptomyces sp. H27-C3 TaxID=3046305 RepID=UPI0024B8ECD8|nr:nickel transporter [Streptomyces sp. H27-C3]MDJ0463843.1 nickel transporter [Streptomyces sp. H27-C3]